MNAKGVYEGQRSTNDNQRVYILTRSAFAGQQRYSATTGVVIIASTMVRFIKAQISSGMNFLQSRNSLLVDGYRRIFCRAPIWETEETISDECANWTRAGSSSAHSFRSSVSMDNFHYGKCTTSLQTIIPPINPSLCMINYAIAWCPTFISLAGNGDTSRLTRFMRGLVMDFGNDKKVLDINDQFMFGPASLSIQWQNKARTRPLYLPTGSGLVRTAKRYLSQRRANDWSHRTIYWYSGVVKAGSIYSMWPRYPLHIRKTSRSNSIVRPIRADNGSFNALWGWNVNYNYEKGKFSIDPLITMKRSTHWILEHVRVNIQECWEREHLRLNGSAATKPSGLDFQSKPDTIISYKEMNSLSKWNKWENHYEKIAIFLLFIINLPVNAQTKITSLVVDASNLRIKINKNIYGPILRTFRQLYLRRHLGWRKFKNS